MLNQLIESKNHHTENTRKNGFLITTLGVLVAVLVSGWTYSLFAKNFGMGTGDFELSKIVAPIAPTEVEPQPEPEPKRPEREQTATNDERLTVIEKIAPMEKSLKEPPRLDESRILKSKPLDPSVANQYSEGMQNKYRNSDSPDGTENSTGIKQLNTSKTDSEVEKVPEVVVKPSPKAIPQKPPTQSLGVINGKATNLVKPAYPAAAKQMRIEGAVNVQVLIDENGNVVSASAVSGHPLLRAVSENAARQSKFSPTYLSKQPVKVTGVIVYQFKSF
jgi:protein TonB